MGIKWHRILKIALMLAAATLAIYLIMHIK